MSQQPSHETNPPQPISRSHRSRAGLVIQLAFSLLVTAFGAYGLYDPLFSLNVKFWTAILICGGALFIWAAYELVTARPLPD